jgi:hypothetical protein
MRTVWVLVEHKCKYKYTSTSTTMSTSMNTSMCKTFLDLLINLCGLHHHQITVVGKTISQNAKSCFHETRRRSRGYFFADLVDPWHNCFMWQMYSDLVNLYSPQFHVFNCNKWIKTAIIDYHFLTITSHYFVLFKVTVVTTFVYLCL